MGITWTIGRKLLGLSALAALLLVLVAVTGIRSIVQIDEALAEVVTGGQAVRAHMRADMMHDALRSDVLAAIIAAGDGDPAERESSLADIREHVGIFRDAITEEQGLVSDPESQSGIERLLPMLETYGSAAESTSALAFTDLAAARAALPDFIRQFEILEPALEEQSDRIGAWADEKRAHSKQIESVAKKLIGAIGALALLVLCVAAVLISRSIVGPIRAAVDITARIADGDLAHSFTATGNDETAQLLQALARMNAAVGEVVSQVRDAAVSVSNSSQEVAAGTLNLSQRVEEQAASLEETSSAMKDISGIVSGNATLAGRAGSIANDAMSRAAASRGVVDRSAAAMEEISTASRRIGEIIGTIDSIAFQTNLLALNAAVEAARAGEQGRGFAVVATEVRNLAQRCAAAAREIKTLIGDSVEKVRQGTELVHESGATLTHTEQSVGELTGLVENVASSSRNQAEGVTQINQAITQMDSVTQQNAALVEQVAAASASMEEQAHALLRAVSFFRTNESAGRSGNGSAQPAAEVQAVVSPPRMTRIGRSQARLPRP